MAEEIARRRIKRVNGAVAEIADQQFAAELTERGRRHRNCPRRIQRTGRGESFLQCAVGLEDIDITVAVARNVVFPFVVLLGVSDVEISADVHDVEWREAGGNIWIRERAGKCGGREGRI